VQKGALVYLMSAMLLLAGGCSEHQPPPCRVSGQLLVRGKPAAGACIRFHRTTDSQAMLLPDATHCEPDGTYRLSVRAAGEYAVTVLWPTITIDQGEEIEGEDRLGGRFKNPHVPVQIVTLVEGENQLPAIDLPHTARRS